MIDKQNLLKDIEIFVLDTQKKSDEYYEQAQALFELDLVDSAYYELAKAHTLAEFANKLIKTVVKEVVDGKQHRKHS